jgi:hypothetical protein
MLAFIIPLLAKYKFNHEITAKEVVLQGVIMTVICSILYITGTYSSLRDVEILNGQVLKKYNKQENCPTYWSDYTDGFCSEYITRVVFSHMSCVTVDKNEVCTPVYKTQYKYIYQWEKRWYVATSFRTHQISRVNKRGDEEPIRWTATKIGDPASITNLYVNYMKVAAHNIINPNKESVTQYVDKVPAYPSTIYDYYQSNKILTVGSSVDIEEWNKALRKGLTIIGPKKQANIIVIITSIQDPTFRYAVEESWLGGKKNDVIILIGESGGNISWVDSITLAGNMGNEMMAIKMRDSLLQHKTLDIKVIDIVLSTVTKHFDRKAMQDLEYLKEQIEPPAWVIITCYLLSIVLGCGLTFYFIRHETI